MIDLQTLYFFKTVAGCGSFSAASHELKYAQSNISTKIIRLENDLQTALFYRDNKGVTLTPKGKIFLDYTEEILRLIRTAETAMRDGPEAGGSMAIGSLETVAQTYLPELLSDYHRNNPKVQLTVKTGTSAALTEAVLNRTLDAAFISGPAGHPELAVKRFRPETLLLASAPDSRVSLDELQDETLLVFPQGCYYRHLLEELLRSRGIVPKQVIEYDSVSAIIAGLCAGLGISLLPASVLSAYTAAHMLNTIEIDDRYSSVDTYLIYRSDSYVTTAFSVFINSLGTA